MSGQERIKPQERDEESEEVQDFPTKDAEQKTDTDIDAMLDEIDGVLEANAEEFVRGFVQKGGQ